MKCYTSTLMLMLMLMVCWASQSLAQPTRAKPLYDTALGTCTVLPRASSASLEEAKPYFTIHPSAAAWIAYPKKIDSGLAGYETKSRAYEKLAASYEVTNVTVLQQPEHGKLMGDISFVKDAYYIPDTGFVGTDKVIYIVTDKAGYKVKVVEYFKVTDISFQEFRENSGQKDPEYIREFCKKGNSWKISTTPEGTLTSTTLDSSRRLGRSVNPTKMEHI